MLDIDLELRGDLIEVLQHTGQIAVKAVVAGGDGDIAVSSLRMEYKLIQAVDKGFGYMDQFHSLRGQNTALRAAL